ncbi:hypothetical protein [Roseibium sp.]|uniref:hypothetical protein n=1 Tax=Roseibium sp. TaxID=1936156 RepID=UPI001B2BA931|nr:hypothetical protein [Roseibium sp.]MBO6856241.1 hypothetical protein [Roseibium sp.]
MEILQVLGIEAHADTDHTVTDVQQLSAIIKLRVQWPDGGIEEIPYGINPKTEAQKAAFQKQVNKAWDEYSLRLRAWEVAYSVGEAALKDKPVYQEPKDLSHENLVRLAVRNWLDADNAVPAWVPPTPDEIRAAIPTVTARQLRHGLLNVSMDEADVEALIAAMPDEEDRKRASIDWRTANEYERLHPLVVQISASLGLTPELVDSLWDFYRTI